MEFLPCVIMPLVVLGLIAGLAALAGVQKAQAEKLRAQANAMTNLLIERLVKRGMDGSAVEMVLRVLADSSDGELPAKIEAVDIMVEHGMDASSVEKVLRLHAECAEEELPAKIAAIQSPVANEMGTEHVQAVVRALQRNAIKPGGSGATAAASAPSAKAPLPPGFEKARLIQQLVEHGMDADGVEKVLRVLAEYADEELPAKITAVASMLEAGMDAGDIERVIRAFQRNLKPKSTASEPPTTAFRESIRRD
jgi:hypothetical protein